MYMEDLIKKKQFIFSEEQSKNTEIPLDLTSRTIVDKDTDFKALNTNYL